MKAIFVERHGRQSFDSASLLGCLPLSVDAFLWCAGRLSAESEKRIHAVLFVTELALEAFDFGVESLHEFRGRRAGSFTFHNL